MARTFDTCILYAQQKPHKNGNILNIIIAVFTPHIVIL